MDPISVCEVIAPTGAGDRQRKSIRRVQRLEGAASIRMPKSGGAFVVCYFAADSHEEMAQYPALIHTPRGSTHDRPDRPQSVTADDGRSIGPEGAIELFSTGWVCRTSGELADT
jgi:hypothetical protein